MTKSQSSQACNLQSDGINKLVNGISHDIGAPLRAVVEFSKILRGQTQDRLDEKERYWLQLIQESGERAQSMIAATVQYWRLMETSSPESSFSLESLLDVVMTRAAERISSKSASVELSVEGIELCGNREHWHLFFECLIDNALLYQGKGDDHLPKIQIEGKRDDERLLICVEDNGIGICESAWEVVTEPFKRLHADKDYPGIGMGLAYCERIAQMHGGFIRFAHSGLNGLAVSYQQVI